MATYVNDLRLKEIATGDESGTWGTSTNTNLELIGEALGYSTEGITTNADTHTTTVADGSTDPGRAMYIKYTGTLDSACTITIAPNTMSRVHIIENGTSGSQNIIISQGSGANVTIPAGDVKVVYLDGAGSGAAVIDAFASLNVVDLKVEDDLTVTDDLIVNGDIDLEGSIDVNGTTNLDVVDIDGALTQDGGAVFNEASADVDFRVESNGNANMLFVDAGNDRVLIGTTASRTLSGVIPNLFKEGTGYNDSSMALVGNTGTTAGTAPLLLFGRSRGTSNGTSTSVASGDRLGGIFFTGADGTDIESLAAVIQAKVDGTPGSNDMPGRLEFYTTPDGSETTVERMRISSNGGVGIGVTPTDGMDANIRYLHIGEQSIFRAGDTDYTDSTVMSTNVYQTGGTNKYITTGFTSSYTQQGGTHFWGTAPSGSANDTATEVEIFRANASGGVTVNNDQNSNINFIAKAGSSANALQVDGSSGAITINEASADADFRVESDSNTHAFFVQASDSTLGINTSSPLNVLDTQFSASAHTSGISITNQQNGGWGSTLAFNSSRSDDSSIKTAARVRTEGAESWNADSTTSSNLIFETRNDNTLAERMKIRSDGNVSLPSQVATGTLAQGRLEVVAPTSGNCINAQVTTSGNTAYGSHGTTTTGGNFYHFAQMINSSGSQVGEIVVSHTGTSYVESSDYRLKENVTELTNATTRLKQLQPKRFNFIEVPDKTVDGFLAHEVSNVVPEAVTGEKDAVDDDGNPDYQGIDKSKLVPLLVAAIQEQQELIETLQTKVAALEGGS